ncbi:MAG: TonB-dependent receptor [Candidatus Binatia bacterium]
MSRQQKRANERRSAKTLRKICLAAGEGVGRAVAFSFALASNASAAEPKKEETFTLPPVVVQEQGKPYVVPQSSLPKFPVPLKDTPQSITIVPERLMEEQAATTVQEALRNVPGIGLQAGEGGGPQGDNLTLRGFNARNDFFIDGIRDQGSYFRDVFNIDSVEVIKGPSSFYFGRGSTGGIINQASKSPRLTASYGGELSAGSGPLFRATADINQPFSDSGAFRVNLMAHYAKFVDRDEAKRRRLGFAPSVSFGLGTPTQLTLSYFLQYENNLPDYGHPFVFGAPPRIDRDTFFGLRDKDYERTLVNIGTARLDHHFSDQLTLRNTLRYSHVDREAVPTAPRIAGTPASGTPLSLIRVNRNRPERDTQESILSNQTDATAKFDTYGIKHTLSTGIELARETFDVLRFNHPGPQTNLANPNPSDPLTSARTLAAKSDTTSLSFGVFAADQIKLNDYFEIVGGARWDIFNTDFDDRMNSVTRERTDRMWSYRGGIIFHPVPNHSYYFSYGSSWNPSAEALSLNNANQGTPPEKNRTFEIGAKIELMEGALNLQAALFQIDKRDARTEAEDGSGLDVLKGKQRVRGLELGIAGRVLPGLNVFTGYTYLDPKILKSNDLQGGIPIEGKDLQNVPEHSATFWTTYDFLDKWQVGGGPSYVGRRYSNNSNTNRIPGYVRWDATVAYKLTENVQFRLNANNLTNKLFYENTHPAHVVPAAGRTFIFSTAFKF